MTRQIIVTVFVVWFFIGLLLSIIGIVIDACTTHFTNLDTIGMWVLIAWLIAVLIALFVSLIILVMF
jgi:hypothetical protein